MAEILQYDDAKRSFGSILEQKLTWTNRTWHISKSKKQDYEKIIKTNRSY